MDRLMSITTTLGILCSKGPYGSWWVNKQASEKLRCRGLCVAAAVGAWSEWTEASAAGSPGRATPCRAPQPGPTSLCTSMPSPQMLRWPWQCWGSPAHLLRFKIVCMGCCFVGTNHGEKFTLLLRVAIISHLRIVVGYFVSISHLIQSEPFCIKPNWRCFCLACLHSWLDVLSSYHHGRETICKSLSWGAYLKSLCKTFCLHDMMPFWQPWKLMQYPLYRWGNGGNHLLKVTQLSRGRTGFQDQSTKLAR